MILEQNYLKIIQYTQKAFRLYCHRALGFAIIKELKKHEHKEKQIIEEENELTSTINGNYLKRSRLDWEPNYEAQGPDEDNNKRMQSTMEKTQIAQKNIDIKNKVQILYGDLVYIQYCPFKVTYRAKSFLNKVKFCKNSQIGVGISAELRCVFQVVYPEVGLEENKKGSVITQSSLLSFRSLGKSQYLKVKKNKIVLSDEFGKQLELSKQASQWSVFQLKYSTNSERQDIIISESQLCIKLFGEDLYMNVLEEEQEGYFSQVPDTFFIRKLKNNKQDFLPVFYTMSSNKFGGALYGNPIDLEMISQKKTMANVLAIDENNVETKINPITFIDYDFTKIPDQDPKVAHPKDILKTQLNCWQLIKRQQNPTNLGYFLFNPILKLGFAIKGSKNTIKLTTNQKQYTILKVTFYENDIISLYSEVHQQEIDVIYERTNEKYSIVLSKFQVLNQSKKLKIQRFQTKNALTVCQLSQIFDVLREVYGFLETWGNQVDEKAEVLYYSVKQIKLGSSTMLKKIRQLRIVLKVLKGYLENPQNYLKSIQNKIYGMKILDFLIMVCKVITTKMGSVYEDQSEESPFNFAKKNLQQILKSLFNILMKLAKDNIQVSNVVISEVSYFNKILIYYPEEIGQILQQSIKNLSVFTSKSNQSGPNQLFLWVKLIEPIQQNTIRIQKTYIDIISETVVDPNDRGIPQYQNRCKELLFIQNSKRKGIPKFGVDPQSKKPIIIFEKFNMMNDFLQKNQQLSKFNLVHLNSASYFIDGFYSDRFSADFEFFHQYSGYIGSVIQMFRNLCRNRNKKLYKIVDDWGLTQEHIQSIFSSKKISWTLKANYLSLWGAIYIDEDPFLPFQKRESKCHYWPKIQKYNLSDCTALIFRQYTDESAAISKLNDFGLKVYPILSNFFNHFQKKLINTINEPSDLKCLLSVLKIVYETINLGYMTLRIMKDYLRVILQISAQLQQGLNGKKSNDTEFKKLCMMIFKKIIEILSLYEDIWIQIYGIEFLQAFYRNSQEKCYVKDYKSIEEKWQSILSSKFQQRNIGQKVQKMSSNRKRTRFNAFSGTQYNLSQEEITDFINFENLSYEDIDEEIITFLITLFLRRSIEHKFDRCERLINLIETKMRRRQRICSYINEILILTTEKQEQIYRNFNGRQSNRLLNWLKIQQLTTKLDDIENQQSNNEIEQRNKRQKILQLNNIMVKINRQLKTYKGQNRQLFVKSQMILEKLNIHKILLQILKFSDKPLYKDVIRTILQFFSHFIFENQANSQKLFCYIHIFTKNLSFDTLTDIIPSLIETNEDVETSFKVINDLVYKISTSQMTGNLLNIICRLLKYQPQSIEAKKFKNNLSRKILQEFNLTSILFNQTEKDQSYQILLKSYDFTKIVCQLAIECPEIDKQIRLAVPKFSILQKLTKSMSFIQKKQCLKLLNELYIARKQLENFEIEQYLKLIVLSQLKKLPLICKKLIQRKNLSNERQIQIHNIFQQLLTYSNTKLETKNEQQFFYFFLDFQEQGEASVLNFCKLVLAKWKNQEKSVQLQSMLEFTRKLQKFLSLVFYQQSSAYHRKIFQQIQQLNIKLEKITKCVSIQDERKEVNITEQLKTQVIQFYTNLTKIIVQQNISVTQLFQCFDIDEKKLQIKRLNFNEFHNVLQSQFLLCFERLQKLIKRKNQFKSLIENVKVFRFVTLIKDKRSKLIDVYSFLQKLIGLMEYNRNLLIKNYRDQSIADQEQKQDQLAFLNHYQKNQLAFEHQFKMQVNRFCFFSHKCKGRLQGFVKKKVKMIARQLKRDTILLWFKDANFNIFIASKNYNSRFLYICLNQLLNYFKQVIQSSMRYYDSLSLSVYDLIKVFTNRFCEQNQIQILGVLLEMARNMSDAYLIGQKIQFFLERSFSYIMNQTLHEKSSRNIQLIQSYRNLFMKILDGLSTTGNFKIKSKLRMSEAIKKLITKKVQLNCCHDYAIVQSLLLMWSENQLPDEASYFQLLADEYFIQFITSSFSKQSLQEVAGSNINNKNKCKFLLLLLNLIVKYSQNFCQFVPTGVRDAVQSMQQWSNKLFREVVQPKIQSHTQESFCLGYNECGQSFCNWQRLTLQDKNILKLILLVFILTRIWVNQRDRTIKKYESESIQKLYNMVGHIKYKIYGKLKSYYFKKPSLHNFKNKEIQKQILNEVYKIPIENVNLYLHALSRVFFSSLIFSGVLARKMPLLAFLFSIKSRWKIFISFFWFIVIILDLNIQLFTSQSSFNADVETVLKVICIIMLIINIFFLVEEINIFKSKCRHLYQYFRLPDSQISQLSEKQIQKPNRKQKQNLVDKKRKHLKISKNDKQGLEQKPCKDKPSNHEIQNTLVEKNNVQASLTKKQIFMRLIESHLIVRIFTCLTYVLTAIKSSFLIYILLASIFDLDSTLKFLKIIYRVLRKLCFLMVINIIYLVFSFLYLASLQSYDNTSFDQVQKILIQKSYTDIYITGYEDKSSEMNVIFMFYRFLFFTTMVTISFYVSTSIYYALKQQSEVKKYFKSEQKKNSIQNCMKYQGNQLWDYLYFFISYDKNGAIHGIQYNIQSQIKNNDYRFVQLY